MNDKSAVFNYFFYFVLIIGLLSLPIGQLAAQNRLPIKEVRVSSIPNYSSLKDYADLTKLTDGKSATGNIFWLDPNSIGWKNHGRITIDIELKDLFNISSIGLNTAKNEAAGVYFPLNVNLFTSIDGKSYSYVGDIGPKQLVQKNLYRTIDMKEKNIDKDAKFIKIVIIPEGTMFFTDDISIYGKKSMLKHKLSAVLSNKQLEDIISQNKKSEINRRLLLNKIRDTPNLELTNVQELREKILRAEGLEESDLYQHFLDSINKLSLSKSRNKTIQLGIFSSPWKSDLLTVNSSSIINAVNTTQYIALEAFNNQATEYSNYLIMEGPDDVKIDIYESIDVRTRGSEIIKDALVPLNLSKILKFSPGEKKVLILAITAIRAVKSNIRFKIGKESESNLNFSIDFVDVGINNKFISSLALNFNVWSYYSYPFFKGRQREIQKDLIDHYVNVFVIPPTILEPNNITTNHSKLIDYLQFYNKDDKVLLFLNHRGYIDNPGNYLQTSWKMQFLSWYKRLLAILNDHNIKSDNIYLYPFDEIKKIEISAFSDFTTWIKSEYPQSKIFTTVFDVNLTSKVQPYSDVIQLLAPKDGLPSINKSTATDFWLYDIMDGSKAVDPYARYRLLAWKAFGARAKGIGFWAYADQYGGSVWDDSDGQQPDYNVVYDLGNKIIPSRRWEATKQGIEDFYILSKYSKEVGISAADKMVKKVLAFPKNPKIADNARREMIEAIIKK